MYLFGCLREFDWQSFSLYNFPIKDIFNQRASTLSMHNVILRLSVPKMNQDLKKNARARILYKLCANEWNPFSEIKLSMDRSVYRVKESDVSVSVKVVVTGETAIDITGRYIESDLG
jgi:hypothetical protein